MARAMAAIGACFVVGIDRCKTPLLHLLFSQIIDVKLWYHAKASAIYRGIGAYQTLR